MLEEHASRVLALVSDDFGELANAMYLLDGTGASVRLLLSPRLQEHNPELSPHTVARYHSAADVIEEMRQFRPQRLLLMSAYLFGVNGLLNLQDVEQILREARTLGVVSATTDPFLGMLSALSESTFASTQGAAAMMHFGALHEALRELPHLYLSPMPRSPSVHTFYNPRVIISKVQKAMAFASLWQGLLKLAAPHWLFVISSADYKLQCALHGRLQFDAMLLEKTQQCLLANRRPILLAPPQACESLRGCSHESVILMAFCNYNMFRTLLLTAEHAFYWNALSNSVLGRIVNGGSVFFMDVGHLARYIPPIVPLAMQSYYANAQLPMLDPSQTLDAGELAQLARVQPETFAVARAALQALPLPAELLASLSAAQMK